MPWSFDAQCGCGHDARGRRGLAGVRNALVGYIDGMRHGLECPGGTQFQAHRDRFSGKPHARQSFRQQSDLRAGRRYRQLGCDVEGRDGAASRRCRWTIATTSRIPTPRSNMRCTRGSMSSRWTAAAAPESCRAIRNSSMWIIRPAPCSPISTWLRNYGFANRMFQTNQGPSFPAHQIIFCGTSSAAAVVAVCLPPENMEFR